jgi:hydrogenase maturation protease
VGPEGERATILASPVILYDYPQVAPESSGDLFDGAEIDEILTLRILALTDAEKDEMRQCDERARQILDRIEADPQHLARLHGTMRAASSHAG